MSAAGPPTGVCSSPHGGLNPVALPVVDARLIHPDPLRGLLLEQSQVNPLGSEVVAISYEGGGIRLGFGFFGQ